MKTLRRVAKQDPEHDVDLGIGDDVIVIEGKDEVACDLIEIVAEADGERLDRWKGRGPQQVAGAERQRREERLDRGKDAWSCRIRRARRSGSGNGSRSGSAARRAAGAQRAVRATAVDAAC